MSDHIHESSRRRPLTPEELERLRAAIDPSATGVEGRALVGGVDTATYALRLQARVPREVVVRVFRGWEGDVASRVRREYATLDAVARATALAPAPILCDAAGDLIGEPLIVMTYLPGAPQPPPADPGPWTVVLADTLVAIHAIDRVRVAAVPPDRSPRERLERRLADPPPQSDALWDEIAAVATGLVDGVTGNAATLIHGDFWFGNTLWQDGRVTAVIDWSSARIGDPMTDVAITRTDLRMFSGERTADVFLRRYESVRGRLRDVAFWDLVAALDPLRWLQHWVAGYQELGVPLSLADARANLERSVRAELRAL